MKVRLLLRQKTLNMQSKLSTRDDSTKCYGLNVSVLPRFIFGILMLNVMEFGLREMLWAETPWMRSMSSWKRPEITFFPLCQVRTQWEVGDWEADPHPTVWAPDLVLPAPEPWEVNCCCLQTTQPVVFCYHGLNISTITIAICTKTFVKWH